MPRQRAPRGELTGLTFQELVDMKAHSRDPKEQKRIRRAIRELRASDPNVPQLRRGISADTGITQLPPGVDLKDVSTFSHTIPVQNWTEAMHFAWIDWQAEHNPLHQPARIDHTGKPVYGCMCSKCTILNGDLYDALVAEDLDRITELYEKMTVSTMIKHELINSAVLFLTPVKPRKKKDKKKKQKKSKKT